MPSKTAVCGSCVHVVINRSKTGKFTFVCKLGSKARVGGPLACADYEKRD